METITINADELIVFFEYMDPNEQAIVSLTTDNKYHIQAPKEIIEPYKEDYYGQND